MNLLKNSLQDELDYFFKIHRNLEYDQRVVSKAAVCKARKNLSHSTFIELHQSLIEAFTAMQITQSGKVFALTRATVVPSSYLAIQIQLNTLAVKLEKKFLNLESRLVMMFLME